MSSTINLQHTAASYVGIAFGSSEPNQGLFVCAKLTDFLPHSRIWETRRQVKMNEKPALGVVLQ